MNFFVVWLTDDSHAALFPAGTVIKDSHRRESPARLKTEPAQNMISGLAE